MGTSISPDRTLYGVQLEYKSSDDEHDTAASSAQCSQIPPSDSVDEECSVYIPWTAAVNSDSIQKNIQHMTLNWVANHLT